MRLVIAVFLVILLLTACSRVSSPEPPEFSVAARAAPNWVEGTALAQNADRVIMRAKDGALYRIDLSTVGVFDCRTDCFLAMRQLNKIEQDDKLCIGFLYVEDGVQTGLVWINRYACPGPTIPS